MLARLHYNTMIIPKQTMAQLYQIILACLSAIILSALSAFALLELGRQLHRIRDGIRWGAIYQVYLRCFTPYFGDVYTVHTESPLGTYPFVL